MKIVIAGGGPAALESAISAKKYSPEAEVAIYSAEMVRPYRRPALSGLLGAGKSLDEKTFFIKPETFFAEQGIEFHGEKKVGSIENKELVFTDGERVNFDRLILACGSEAFRPPIPGADGENVFTLRSLDDMRHILEKIDKGISKAVIIGGGVLGLEIAESFISREIETVVLENSDQLFPGRLSREEADELLARLLKHNHLHIICANSAEKIMADGVKLKSGETLPADLVIMSCGSRPDLSLAAGAGLACGRGIIVNEFMQSSREDIFVAGDMAEFEGRCFNLYMDAVNSGKIAGANAAGEKLKFSAQFSPVRFFALGEKLVMK